MLTINRTLLWSALLLVTGLAHAQTRFRLADPQAFSGAGNGWTVDPSDGAVSFAIPIATVPGEIPIPAIFQIAGSHSAQERKVWESVQVGSKVIWTLSQVNNLHRPLVGTLHFGYIDNGGTVNGLPNSATYVLEDGSQFREEDWVAFTTYNNTFTLPEDFGLAPVAVGAVKISSNRAYAYYTTSGAGLGTAINSKIQATLPVGHATPTQFRVILDKDRARVMGFLSGLNTWAPLLWLDRFGHQVAFKWTMGTAGLPVGATALHSVVVTNQRTGLSPRGLQVQWATWSTVDQERDLLRADFIGVDAPSIFVRGYSGQSALPPVGMTFTSAADGDVMVYSKAAGIVGRPTLIQVGHSTSVTLPSWIGSGSALPVAPPVRQSPAEAGLRSWSIIYDANRAAIRDFTDAAGVTTHLDYGTATFPYAFSQGPRPTYGLLWKHGVVAATSTDSESDPISQTTPQFKRTWERSTVVNNTWTTTHQAWWPSVGAPQRKTVFGFGSDVQAMQYANAKLALQRTLSIDGAIEYSKTAYTLDVGGLTGEVSVSTGLAVSRRGEASYREGTGYQNGQVSVQNRFAGPPDGILGGESPVEQTDIVFDVRKDKLDVGRPASVTVSRTNGTGPAIYPTRVTRFEYDATSRLPKKQFLDGGQADGQLGQVATFDAEGRPLTGANFASFSTDGVATVATSYGNDGYPSSQVNVFSRPSNQSGSSFIGQSVSFDGAGRIVSQVDALGIQSWFEHDTLGRPLARSRQGEPSVSYTYPSERLRTSSRDGRTTTERMDGFGRLLSRTLPDGRRMEFIYDVHGRQVVQREFDRTGGSSRSSLTSYDLLDRPIAFSSAGGAGQTISYAASADGKLSLITTSRAGISAGQVETRNVLGQVIKVEAPSGGTTTMTYDGAGNLISTLTRDGANNTQERTFLYNALGLLTRKTEPETGVQTFAGFNALGQPGTVIEAVGTADARTRTILFDGLGRVCKVSSNTGGETLETFYDGALLTGALGGGATPATMAFTYGPASLGRRLVSESTSMGGIATALGYTYLGSGQLDTISYPSGRLVGYTYDSDGRITGIQDRSGGGSQPIVASITPDDWGQRRRLTFGSGAYSDWSTQDLGTHLKDWTIGYTTGGLGDPANPRLHTYDLAERLTRAGEWQNMAHDSADRLGYTDAPALGVSAITLNHDAFGNNISQNATGTSNSSFNNFTFTPLTSNQLPGSTGWVKNGRGEATQVATGTASGHSLGLTWDALGRVSQVNSTQGALQTNTYAPSGLRIRLQDAADPSRNRRYAYTSGGLLMSEFGGIASASAVHSGQKAVRMHHVGNQGWSGFSRYLGTFRAGDTVTATAWFQAPAGTFGEVFLGDAGGPDPYDNANHTYINGNGGWQSITLSWTMKHDDEMWLYLYGNQWTPTGYGTTTDVDGPAVTWDDATVFSVQRGSLFAEGFESGVTSDWSINGTPYDLVSLGQEDPNVWRRDVIYLGGQAVAEVDAAGIHELHADHLGSPRIITWGSDGTIEGKQAFGPYGEYLQSQAAGYQPLTGYTGHLQNDAPTGLIYMRGRFYSPAWHRFVNSDQGVDPNSWNQMAYVGGSPFMATDPSGMMKQGEGGFTCENGRLYRDGKDQGRECSLGSDGTIQFGGGGATVQVGAGSSYISPSMLAFLLGYNSPITRIYINGREPQSPKPKVDCNTVLPDGRTVGQVVQQYRAQLQAVANNAMQDPMGSASPGELSGAMYSIAKSGGPIDFKRTFRGQANATMLGQAGNFAYFAIGSGILPTMELDAMAGGYAIYSFVFGSKKFSDLTPRFGMDKSAASVRDAALAANGCQ